MQVLRLVQSLLIGRGSDARRMANAEFWRTKILGNQRRDRAVNRLLKKAGWRVVRIWEHALTKKNAPRTVARLQRVLQRAL
jgi:DNA mismatch endonuclease, patch repair protein